MTKWPRNLALGAVTSALLLSFPGVAVAQLTGARTSFGCLRVRQLDGNSIRVTAQGRLSLQSFAGPPNYASVADGDEEERTFILELPGSDCTEDAGELVEPGERFTRVHVSTSNDALMNILRASVGQRVTVSGEGFAAFTGHHHAPLVILAEQVATH